jgi:uncharacterized protein (TIGR03000 family)
VFHAVDGVGLDLFNAAPNSTPTKDSTKKAKQAVVLVTIPPAAKLQIGDTQTKSTGIYRTFKTPPLTPGKVYYYTLKAEIPSPGGTARVITNRVAVQSGQWTRENFIEEPR